jgi:hypothetical protein
MEKYSRSSEIIDGSLDDNQIMMHIGKGKYFGLNPVGKRIWELIENPKTLYEITELLLSEYNLSAEQCKQEVQIFMEKAVKYGIITKNEDV